jgi:hypothetical protein
MVTRCLPIQIRGAPIQIHGALIAPEKTQHIPKGTARVIEIGRSILLVDLIEISCLFGEHWTSYHTAVYVSTS